MISEEAKLFIDRCFSEKGESVAIKPYFNETYLINNKKCKMTKEVLTEMLSTGKIKIVHEDNKCVNMVGVKGIKITYE